MKKIPSKITVSQKEYDIITKNYGDNPCNTCGLPFNERAACYGCPVHKKWANQFENIPKDLIELVKTYNQTHVIDSKIQELYKEIKKLKRQKESILEDIGEITINK